MSKLRIQSLTMPAADLGPENPLPPLCCSRRPPHLNYEPGIPRETVENIGYGHISSILPYTLQDGFDRQLRPAEFRVAVLENELLQATFLLDYGGRLWSLIHKPSGRELLEVNPVFQLANLAIRNAWFSGGVEWNIGTIGHSPFTCSPLFAGHLERSDGTPILRLYEWERFRGVPFQIDAYLPDGSPVLFVHVRIMNPNEHDVPMYWWSNIAVPERSEIRVIAPADSAYCLGCRQDELVRIPVPYFDRTDFTYSTNVAHATDFFFHIPVNQRPWIVALDGAGRGLVQVSTERMMGRKLWVWGTGRGGRNWQRFLSPTGKGYIEIQAGLTRTQLEHLRMPASANWSWLEAYGLLEADPSVVHGSDWERARQSVEIEVEGLISHADLLYEFEYGGTFADEPPLEVFHRGSGWGALERRRRAFFNEPPLCSSGLVFDDNSLGEEQAPWISLLKEGRFPTYEPETPPWGFVVGEEWQDLLENSLLIEGKGNWLAWLHLGVMNYYKGDLEGARKAWERSFQQIWTPWAIRNLAILNWEEGRLDEAGELLIAACRKLTSLLPLAAECGQCLIEAGRTHEWLDLLPLFPPSVRAAGRIRLLAAQAALVEGELQIVESFFEDGVTIADLREGEISLSELWFAYHEYRLSVEESVPLDDLLRAQVRSRFPVPDDFDFRIQVEKTPADR